MAPEEAGEGDIFGGSGVGVGGGFDWDSFLLETDWGFNGMSKADMFALQQEFGL